MQTDVMICAPCESGLKQGCWVAVQVRPNHECATAQHFGLHGQEYFLPLYRTRRQWSDRMKELDVPLFPGYLFCRYEERARCKILSTAGVLRILGYGDRPVPVNDDEMAAIERVTQSGYECHPMEYLGTGCRVRVNSGALKGLEGRVIAVKAKKQRFVVSLTLLQRSVAVEVEVEADCLSPCETAFQTES